MDRPLLKTHSQKPEVVEEYREDAEYPRFVPPKTPPFVRFMSKYGTYVVIVFMILVMAAYSSISQNALKEFEVMRLGSISRDSLASYEPQASVESYLGYALLTDVQFHNDQQAECALAYKLLGGAENKTRMRLYAVATYEAGYFSEGEFALKEGREYMPVIVDLAIGEDGLYSLQKVEWLTDSVDYDYRQATVKEISKLMPEKFAERVMDNETAVKDLQKMVDRHLGRIW